MRNETGYLPYRFREAAVLLVLCLLAAAVDLSVSILSPKSYSETAREAKELRAEIGSGMRTGGAGSADPAIRGTEPAIMPAGAAEEIPVLPAETAAAAGKEIGMGYPRHRDSCRRYSAGRRKRS